MTYPSSFGQQMQNALLKSRITELQIHELCPITRVQPNKITLTFAESLRQTV